MDDVVEGDEDESFGHAEAAHFHSMLAGNCFLKRGPREISNTRPYVSHDHPTHTAPAIRFPADTRDLRPRARQRYTTSPDYSPRRGSESSRPEASSAFSPAFGPPASAAARAPAGFVVHQDRLPSRQAAALPF